MGRVVAVGRSGSGRFRSGEDRALLGVASLWSLSFEVYPRVCGGTPRCVGGRRLGRGLSPRVRGNLPTLRRRRGRSRSIPACAGEPACLSRPGCNVGVYPRVCGGTTNGGHMWRCHLGLSPRVRGNPSAASRSERCCGSIPACAGEPGARPDTGTTSTVYPRVCGGTRWSLDTPRIGPGLSPRVRGNRGRAAGSRPP